MVIDQQRAPVGLISQVDGLIDTFSQTRRPKVPFAFHRSSFVSLPDRERVELRVGNFLFLISGDHTCTFAPESRPMRIPTCVAAAALVPTPTRRLQPASERAVWFYAAGDPFHATVLSRQYEEFIRPPARWQLNCTFLPVFTGAAAAAMVIE